MITKLACSIPIAIENYSDLPWKKNRSLRIQRFFFKMTADVSKKKIVFAIVVLSLLPLWSYIFLLFFFPSED